MSNVKRLLLLLAVLVLLSWASPGEAMPACDYAELPMSNGLCVYSWCYGTGCHALDCVYTDGTPEVHQITAACGVS